MKCNDCIYEKMCESRYEREHCLSFKDKANFVEVVRCKDCKYFGKDLGYGKHDCKKYEMPYCLETDYCSYGERREDK